MEHTLIFTKTCGICKQVKSCDDFYNRKASIDGKAHDCKICHNKSSKEWGDKNPDKRDKAKKKWAKANRDYHNLHTNNWRIKYGSKYLDSSKKNTRKIKYGLTSEDFDKMVDDQNGKCLICQTDLDFSVKKSNKTCCVDHNHKTFKVRGLLCSGCNTGLGMFKESIDSLKSAIMYLENDG